MAGLCGVKNKLWRGWKKQIFQKYSFKEKLVAVVEKQNIELKRHSDVHVQFSAN